MTKHDIDKSHAHSSFCFDQIGIDPDVLGYQVLVKAPVIPDRSKGGIIIVDSIIDEQARRQNVGLVLKMAPDAFTGSCENRRCKVGEWIAYSNFERSPEFVGEHRLYYLSDAHVLARYSEEDVKKILEIRK